MNAPRHHPGPRLYRFLRRSGIVLAGMILLAACALILTEIIIRQVAGLSLLVVEEFAGYAMVTMVFMGAAEALRQGAHIRVDLLRARLPRGAAAALDRLAMAAGFVVAGVVSWSLLQAALDAWRFGSVSYHPSRTPMVIPHTVAWLGSLLLVLEFLCQMLSPGTSELSGASSATESGHG